MSVPKEELIFMFQEADRRGDKQTAMAIMDKLEQMQQPAAQSVQPQQPPAVMPEQTGAGLGLAFGGDKQDLGFVGRTALDLEKRKQEVTETVGERLKGKIGTTEAGIQILGKGVAGSFFDVMGEAVTSGVQAAEAMAPETAESIKAGWEWLSETGAGETLGSIVEGGAKTYGKFKEANPRVAKDIESVVNIGMLIAPVKVRAKVGPSMLGKPAIALEKSAQRSARKNKQVFVNNLISPEKIKKVKETELARTSEKGIGPFKEDVIELSTREKAISKEVNRIPNVSNKKTMKMNLREIRKINKKYAISLEKKLDKAQKPVPKIEAKRNIDNALIEVLKEPSLVNLEKIAEQYAISAKEIIDKYPGTPKGIFKARKEFDKLVEKQKGNVLGVMEKENAVSITARAIRTSMNDFVAKHVPSVKFKADLKKQNLLYDAIENITPKAAKEPSTAILRAWQNSAKATGFKSKLTQELALFFGIGGLGAAAMFAPYLTLAYGVYFGSKAIKHVAKAPGARKGAAKLIKMVDRAILSSKNPSMVKQLRADRMVLVEFLKTKEESEP